MLNESKHFKKAIITLGEKQDTDFIRSKEINLKCKKYNQNGKKFIES
jgi:hypothetical protein